MKYIKLFNEYTDYEQFMNTGDICLPNLSYCENDNKFYFNLNTEHKLIVIYNVEDDNELTVLYCYELGVYATDIFSEIEIDNVKILPNDLDNAEGKYQLSNGEHVVKYTLINPEIICSNLFTNCYNIKNIRIPKGVKYIADAAFSNCQELIGITIPDSVINIGNDVFMNCSEITSISLPVGVTSLGDYAFQNCLHLTNTNIPDGITSIGEYTFSLCMRLTNINIPNSVLYLEEASFFSCKSFTNINIPNSVRLIGKSAFKECKKLETVVIGSGITSIEENAFYDCSELSTLTINAINPPTLGNNVFSTLTNDFKIYVPEESIDVYKTSPNWSTLANNIYAI